MDVHIKQPYTAQKGNRNGVPFVYVSVNMIAYDFLQAQTEDFIAEYSLQIVADDYNRNPALGPLHTNRVHDLFQQPFLKPVIVVINCLSNSTSHPQWMLIVNHGGGSADWLADMARWRAAIDTVQAPRPLLENPNKAEGVFQFTFPGQHGRTNRVECTTDLVNWTALTNISGTNAPVTFWDSDAAAAGQRFYRVRRL